MSKFRCPTCDRPPKGQFENRDGCPAFAYSPKARDEYSGAYERVVTEGCLPFAVDWRSCAFELSATLDAERQDRAALVAERDRLKAEIVQWRLATNTRNPDEAERDVKKWAGELLTALDERDALTRRVGELEAEADVLLVLGHPRFFRIERCHLGHMGECPDGHVSDYDGLPCWRFDVGVALAVGRVDWWHGATWREAVAKAATAIKAR